MNERADRTLIVTIPGLAEKQVEDLFEASDPVQIAEKRAFTGMEDFMIQVGIGIAIELGAQAIIHATGLVQRLITRARERKVQTITAVVPTKQGNVPVSLRLDAGPAAEQDFLNKIVNGLEQG